MKRVEARFESIDVKLGTISDTLTSISGGKKAMWGLFRVVGIACGIAAALAAMFHNWKGM